MRQRRPLLAVALAASVAVLAGGCGGGGSMSATAGRQKANETRGAVARDFWALYGSAQPLSGSLSLLAGSGRFAQCADRRANSVVYGVSFTSFAKGAHTTSAQVGSELLARFASVGWSLKRTPSTGDPTYSATRGGVVVKLVVLAQPASDDAGVSIYLTGPCTDVGQAQNDIVRAYGGTQGDSYTSTPASPSPIPTTFPSPDQP